MESDSDREEPLPKVPSGGRELDAYSTLIEEGDFIKVPPADPYEPYVYDVKVGDCSVELIVKDFVYTGGTVKVSGEIPDSSLVATEYVIKADDEVVIDGGEDTRISTLKSEICIDVGIARDAKSTLAEDENFTEDELDKFAVKADNIVQKLHENTNINNAESIMKAIALNRADYVNDIDSADDIYDWIEESKQMLNDALKNLDTMESMAQNMLDESRNSTEFLTNIDEIRTQIYDSNVTREKFVERSHRFENGDRISINHGKFPTVTIKSNDGKENTIYSGASPAEAIKEYNEEILDRKS